MYNYVGMITRMREAIKGFLVLILFSSFFSIPSFVFGLEDTITGGKPLRDGNTIVSSGGNFELGFFSPNEGNPRIRYLGIWYKKIPTRTVVWVANRDTPLTDSTGVLRITGGGNLELNVGCCRSTIWNSSNSATQSQNPVAVLLDSGNLVVRDAGVDYILWQSFDYPGNTLLPGMKLGRNLVTGLDRSMSSWKTSSDPSSGDYKALVDLSGFPQLVITKGPAWTFRDGPWNGLRFSGLPSTNANPIYQYHFVVNQQEIYYDYGFSSNTLYMRLVLNEKGVLQRFVWNYKIRDWVVLMKVPENSCDAYALCSGNGACDMDNNAVCGCLERFKPRYPSDWASADWSNGCVRETPLNCSRGDDGFIKYSGVKLPDTSNSWFNSSMNLEECQKQCLKNCTCMAYANMDVREGGSGCFLWFGDLLDINKFSDRGDDIYIRMASSELDSAKMNHEILKLVLELLSLVLLGLFAALGLTLATYIWYKKQNQRVHTVVVREGRVGFSSEQNYSIRGHREEIDLPIFDLVQIAYATNNFCIRNKLGEGGYGPVYKGILEDGQEIAVKRLSKSSKQGGDEFKNEVIYIAKLQHRNLVKLLGCCIQDEEKMLIYEYMHNKSLDFFIFDETRKALLDWPKRFHIINGIARGLLYLHQDSHLRIIHRDLKASNILLDKDMNPKISDFGLARSCEENETQKNTSRVVGTQGYMSPEYAVDGFFSIKSDVFSFGVLVLEIVSGKKNRGFFHPDHYHNLLGHAWRLFNEDKSLELCDYHKENSCYISQALQSIHVGLLCVQQCPEDRPNMSSVVLMLASDTKLTRPKQPGFFTERNIKEANSSLGNNASASCNNEITVTLQHGR